PSWLMSSQLEETTVETPPLSRPAIADGDSFTFQSAEVFDAGSRASNDLRGTAHIRVAHGENTALPVGPAMNLDVCKIRVPGNVNPSLEQRIHLRVVIREKNEVHGDTVRLEVLFYSFPYGH